MVLAWSHYRISTDRRPMENRFPRIINECLEGPVGDEADGIAFTR